MQNVTLICIMQSEWVYLGGHHAHATQFNLHSAVYLTVLIISKPVTISMSTPCSATVTYLINCCDTDSDTISSKSLNPLSIVCC